MESENVLCSLTIRSAMFTEHVEVNRSI